MIDRDALGAVPNKDSPHEYRCHECGTTDGLHYESGVMMCAGCFEEAFPDADLPPKLSEVDEP